MEYKTITFYKYVKLENPDQMTGYFRGLCESLGLLGRILIGKEGINAGVSGTKQNVEKFKELIEQKRQFSKMTYREQEVPSNSYHKLVCKVRKEIVTIGEEVDMSKKGLHVSPLRMKKWLDRKEDIIVLDARNDYEAKIGKFENAVTLPIDRFKDFPEAAKKALKGKEDKKIVMYCTGGIRCEKSSAYLRQNGFKKVFQLQGGIINYVNQFPNDHYKGKCFVFDDRISGEAHSESVLSNCEICGADSDLYINCHNLECDKLIVECPSCQEKMNMTCSEACKAAPRQRPKLMISN